MSIEILIIKILSVLSLVVMALSLIRLVFHREQINSSKRIRPYTGTRATTIYIKSKSQ